MRLAIRTFDPVGAACALILAVLLAPGGARGDITLSFSPLNGVITQNVFPAPPETLVVQVTVDAAAVDLRGFSLVLEFDPTYVTPVSVVPGTLLSGVPCGNFFDWLNAAAIGDSIEVDGAGLGCSMAGPGDVVALRFVGVPGSFGTSPLTWRRVRMRDAANDTLAVDCVDGTIQHKPFIISTRPLSFARAKALYR